MLARTHIARRNLTRMENEVSEIAERSKPVSWLRVAAIAIVIGTSMALIAAPNRVGATIDA